MTKRLAILILLIAFAIPAFARGARVGHRSTKVHKVRVHKPHQPRKHKNGF